MAVSLNPFIFRSGWAENLHFCLQKNGSETIRFKNPPKKFKKMVLFSSLNELKQFVVKVEKEVSLVLCRPGMGLINQAFVTKGIKHNKRSRAMKITRLLTVAAALFIATMQAQSATVAYWDFENSTETGTTPTDGQPFCSADSGGAFGSMDSVGGITMYGWAVWAGPEFTSDNLFYNGFAADFLDSNRDGYVWDTALTLWQPTNWTVECAVKLDDTGGWKGFIGKRGSSHGKAESDFYLQKEGDTVLTTNDHFRLRFQTLAGEDALVDATNVVIEAGQWYGVAAVSDGLNAYLYVDANDGAGYQLGGTYTYTNAPVSNVLSVASGDWIFGCGWYNGGLVDHLNGQMDNIRFSDSALTPGEMLPVPVDPFVITVSPTVTSSDTSQTIEATIVDLDSEFTSAALSLDGSVVANNNTPSGTTNVVSYEATMSIGTHTGSVVIVGANPSITLTNSWTFEISQPPWDSITTSPTGVVLGDSQTLEAVILENFSIVDGATTLYLDGVDTGATINRSLAPTSTISFAATGLSHGVHTGKVVVVGDPSGLETNEWTFTTLVESTIPTALVHHWDFDDGSGSTVADLIGSANGTIIGTNHAWIAGGLDLFGGGGSQDWNPGGATNGIGSYVDLPNGIISSLGNAVTFEVTYISETTNGWWQRVYDFGESTGGENYSMPWVGSPYEGGGKYVFLTPWAGNGTRLAVSTNSPPGEVSPLQSGDQNVGNLTHVVWVYDADGKMAKLYQNGVLVDSQLAVNWPLSNLNDVNNWLGRAQYGDDLFNGKLYDMRIYNGIMTAAEVAVRYDEESSVGPTVDPDIESIVMSAGSALLTWTSESGVTYTIMSKTALTDPTWTTNKSGIASAGDGTTSDSVTATADAEFYQIKGE